MTFPQPTPEHEDTSPTPVTPGTLIKRRGVYHTMSTVVPHTPAQEAWFTHVCDDVEGFVAEFCADRDPAHLPWISLAIHCLADALYERLSAEAHWAAIDIHDALRLAAGMDMMAAGIVFRILAAFYAHLGHEGLVPFDQAEHWRGVFADFAHAAEPPSVEPSTENRRERRSARKREKRARRKNRRR